MPVPELRPTTYKAVVAGWFNRDEEEGRKKRLRQAVTLTHLEMMKLLLKLNEPRWTLYKKKRRKHYSQHREMELETKSQYNTRNSVANAVANQL